MTIRASLSCLAEIAPLRERYREEMNCQITHDSIHRRPGWTTSWLLTVDGSVAGYGAVAVAGPWRDKPTVIEYHVLPEHGAMVFRLFRTLAEASGAQFIEVQTNATLLAAILMACSSNAVSESIVFQDRVTTALPANGAVLRRVNSLEEARQCFAQRQGSSEWQIELEGKVIGSGGIAFHYNFPYGDVYMEIQEGFRRRGLGAWLVQELKRVCREDFQGVPCARCNTANLASRRTLQKAGFVPCAHILNGAINLPLE